MDRRLVLVTLLFASSIAQPCLHSSFAQGPESDQTQPIESPPPLPEPLPLPAQGNEDQPPGLLPQKPTDAVTALGDLRNTVLALPHSAEARLKLAEGLYRIGDLDAAIDECRVALKLEPNNVRAHLLLSVTLMAKQDGRAAATALMETILLAPKSAQAHYSLGAVQYSLGNLPASIQSYRRTLELQPNFPDARYRLALVLKLANHPQESAQFMEEAAAGGISQAQYFTGNAYRHGQGVKKNQALAIRWWTKAIGLGHPRAAESLSQLRRQALSSGQPEARRKEALEAFGQYRDLLWADYPDMIRHKPNASLGVALLNENRASNGVATLLDEALALHEPAQEELARLYESGLDPYLAQFDPRMLACFETLAADGFIPAKKTLARIYGKGLGVTRELYKARAILKGLSQQDIASVMDEIAER